MHLSYGDGAFGVLYLLAEPQDARVVKEPFFMYQVAYQCQPLPCLY